MRSVSIPLIGIVAAVVLVVAALQPSKALAYRGGLASSASQTAEAAPQAYKSPVKPGPIIRKIIRRLIKVKLILLKRLKYRYKRGRWGRDRFSGLGTETKTIAMPNFASVLVIPPAALSRTTA